MKTWLIGGVIAASMLASIPANAQTTVKFGYLADPSHEAVMWALKNGKVKSDKIRVEATPLNISALIQATAARSYDVIQTAAVAIPRARARGLDLRIVAAGLRYHGSGEGAGIWVKKGSPIKSAADLKGKKLGVYSLGSAGITLIRIALADVHGLNVAVRGGDLEFVEMPAPALPAALASGRIDAATLIHAQAFKAAQNDDFVAITQTAGDLTKKFGVRMVSAVLAGYGDKLDASPETYKELLRVLRASVDYALKNQDEVFPAVAKATNTDAAFFKAWFTRYSDFPAELTKNDIKAVELLWKRSIELGILKEAPPVMDTVWKPAIQGYAVSSVSQAGRAVPAGLTPSSSPTRRAWILHGFTVAVLAVWWIYSQFVPAYQLPGPVAVARRMAAFVYDPLLAMQLGISLAHATSAILLAFVIGAGLAFSAHFVPATRLLIDSRATPFLNAFSGIGWLFLGILWFGIDSTTVVFAVTMILIPFATINLRAGLIELDAELMELGRSLTRAPARRFAKLMLPMLVPYMFGALRISFGVAWKVTLTAELFGGNAGVGYMLNVARQEFDTETIFAVILFILLFVACAEVFVFRPLQRRLDRRYGID